VLAGSAVGDEIVYNGFGPGDSTDNVYQNFNMQSQGGMTAGSQLASPFILQSASHILSKVTVAISKQNNAAYHNGTIELSLYSDLGGPGAPASKLQVINTGHNYTTSNGGVTTFTVANGYEMTPGAKYWIVATPAFSPEPASYFWARSPVNSGGGRLASYHSALGGWYSGWLSANAGAIRIETIDRPNADYVPTGVNQSGSCNGGGAGGAGGFEYTVPNVTGAGVIQADYKTSSWYDLTEAERQGSEFHMFSDPMQFWDITFDGTFEGTATLTFAYDDTTLGDILEEQLIVWHRTGPDSWEGLTKVSQDLDANTITVLTDSFSPFALGAVPEPATMSLLALGGLVLLRRRRG